MYRTKLSQIKPAHFRFSIEDLRILVCRRGMAGGLRALVAGERYLRTATGERRAHSKTLARWRGLQFNPGALGNWKSQKRPMILTKLSQIKPWDIFYRRERRERSFMKDGLVCRRKLSGFCEGWLQAKAASTLPLCRRTPKCRRVGEVPLRCGYALEISDLRKGQ